MKNPNFNQLTKTIALSLILAIVSGFGNDSINAQTPTSPTVQITSQSCPTQNVDLNQLKTTLNERYNIFNDSLPGLFTSLRNPDTQLETIKTQDQITNLGSIYQCVLEAQDNSNLGAREERIAIRQTITNISNILKPAKDDGFTEETLNTLRTNLNIVEEDGNLTTDLDETIDEIEENLKNLSTKLNSQIQALDNTSKDVPTGNSTNANSGVEDNNTKPPTDSSLFLTRGLLTIVGALAIVVLSMLLIRKNRQPLNFDQEKQEKKEEDKQFHQKSEKEYQNLDSNYTQLEKEIAHIKSQLSTANLTTTKTSNSSNLIEAEVADLNQKYQELAAKILSIENYQKEIQDSLLSLGSMITAQPVITVTSDNTTLTPEVQQILHLYHHRYRDLENSSIGVSQDPDNYSKRLSGTNIPVILVRNPNNKFLIVDDRYLVPKSGLNITTIIKQTIDDIFECQSFYASTSFKVVQPAIVDRIQDDRWQVNQKGVLQFD